MNIILEGPDSTGKSTLARIIAEHVPYEIKGGEGPSKSQKEILDRATRYLRRDNMIFDRHPCVSEPIYGRFREPATFLPTPVIDYFYRSKPLFIYCYGGAYGEHQLKDYDTAQHVGMLDLHDMNIRNAYMEWAQGRVPISQWYSLEDPDVDTARENIIKICQEATQ